MRSEPVSLCNAAVGRAANAIFCCGLMLHRSVCAGSFFSIAIMWFLLLNLFACILYFTAAHQPDDVPGGTWLTNEIVPPGSHRAIFKGPCNAMPCCAMPCHAVPCNELSCRAMPCRAMPCHAMPRRAVPCRAVPCRAMQCRAVQCRAVQCCECAWACKMCM